MAVGSTTIASSVNAGEANGSQYAGSSRIAGDLHEVGHRVASRTAASAILRCMPIM